MLDWNVVFQMPDSETLLQNTDQIFDQIQTGELDFNVMSADIS